MQGEERTHSENSLGSGLDFGAIKGSIAKSWQAKKLLIIHTWFIIGRLAVNYRLYTDLVTKASMLAEFFFALAMLWWEGLRALKIDISS